MSNVKTDDIPFSSANSPLSARLYPPKFVSYDNIRLIERKSDTLLTCPLAVQTSILGLSCYPWSKVSICVRVVILNFEQRDKSSMNLICWNFDKCHSSYIDYRLDKNESDEYYFLDIFQLILSTPRWHSENISNSFNRHIKFNQNIFSSARPDRVWGENWMENDWIIEMNILQREEKNGIRSTFEVLRWWLTTTSEYMQRSMSEEWWREAEKKLFQVAENRVMNAQNFRLLLLKPNHLSNRSHFFLRLYSILQKSPHIAFSSLLLERVELCAKSYYLKFQ